MAEYTYDRADARRGIATRLQDLRQLIASEDCDPGIFTDVLRLVDADSAYIGSWGVVTSRPSVPADVGTRFRVTSSSGQNYNFQFVPELASGGFLAGDTIDLFNLAGRGFTIDQYDEAINESIFDLFPDFMTPEMEDVTAGYNHDTTRIPTNEDWYFAYDVQYSDPGGRFQSLEPRWWKTDVVSGDVVIMGEHAPEILFRRAINLYGMVRPALPTSDSSQIKVPREYLTFQCAGIMSSWQVGSRDRLQQAQILLSMADRARPSVEVFNVPNLRRLRW